MGEGAKTNPDKKKRRLGGHVFDDGDDDDDDALGQSRLCADAATCAKPKRKKRKEKPTRTTEVERMELHDSLLDNKKY